ncbi:Putative adhesin [Arcanobacterium phocae]|uniref:Putative adhesin n=1 Tax=Arcanobacterium phocae TaxID=131112 RepID=A0A1H2LI05_9ACTO|nr:DUF4097 family beta strand repeat-containing protein [Arcanobacterium phocae]SDU80201.1 Putative adhesin [Arcanobacterium phocae]
MPTSTDIDIKLYTYSLSIKHDPQLVEPTIEMSEAMTDVAYDISANRIYISQAQPPSKIFGIRAFDRSLSGTITLTLPATTAHGKIKLGSGGLVSEIDFSDISVKLGAGNIQLPSLTNAEIKTGAGDIHIAQGEHIAVKTGCGNITVDQLHSQQSSDCKTGVGRINVGHLHGSLNASSIELKSGSGNILVGIVPETAIYLDLQSGLGEVNSDLSEASQPLETSQRVKLEVKTGIGRIDVQRSQG